MKLLLRIMWLDILRIDVLGLFGLSYYLKWADYSMGPFGRVECLDPGNSVL